MIAIVGIIAFLTELCLSLIVTKIATIALTYTGIYDGDTVVLYGRSNVLRELNSRRNDASGQRAQQAAVNDQKGHDSRQEQSDRQYRRKKRK